MATGFISQTAMTSPKSGTLKTQCGPDDDSS